MEKIDGKNGFRMKYVSEGRIKKSTAVSRAISWCVSLLVMGVGLAFFPINPIQAQNTLFSEGFETDGNPARYSTSVAEFVNSTQEYFSRTDGSNISVDLTNPQGSYYFAGQAIEGGATLPVTLTFSGIDIDGHSNLEFFVYLAEDDEGTKESWDGDDYVHIKYRIDGGAYASLIHIENVDGKKNSAPAIDTNFDGNGNGTVITNAFTQFSAQIGGTGSTLDLVIEFSLDETEDDIAIDELLLLETVAPTVTTGEASDIGETFATLGGEITSTGGSVVTERGFYSSEVDGFADGTGTKISEVGDFGVGTYSIEADCFEIGTTYYFKAFATNAVGTVYGTQATFSTTTGGSCPSVTTTAATAVLDVSATVNGEVTNENGSSVTERGFVYSSTDVDPRIGEEGVTKLIHGTSSGTGTFSSSLSGLSPDTQYYVNAYAINGISVGYGETVTFTTISEIAKLPTAGYFEDFSGFNGSGFSNVTTSGHLNSTNWRVTGGSDGDMAFEGTYTSGSHPSLAGGTSAGGVSSEGIYAFTVDGDIVFGLQPGSSDFTPGTITLRLENTTGSTLTSVGIEYDIFEYNDAGHSNSLSLYVSSDDITYTAVTGLAYQTTETAGSSAWDGLTISGTITGLSIADGAYLYLQWQTDTVSGNAQYDEFGLTNLTVSPVFGVIDGAEGSSGWRMLSTPVQNASYREVLGSIWSQCFTGARYNGAFCDGGDESNVVVLNSSGSYVSISDLDDLIDTGHGFAVFVYEYDDDLVFDGNGNVTSGRGSFPKTITVAGSEPSGDITPTLNDGSLLYTLLGNPYASTISPYDENGDITGNDISNVIYVYDHNYTSGFSGEDEANEGGAGGGWRTWNGSAGGLTDGKVAPYQGFMVVNLNPGLSSFTVRTSSITDGGTLHGHQENTQQNPKPAIQLAARINEAQVSDVWFSFSEEGSLEANRFDAAALYALDYAPYLMFYAVSGGRAIDIKTLPADLEGELSIPLKMNGWKPVDDPTVMMFEPMGGSVEIIWPTLRNIPEEWSLSLTDHETGISIDLKDPSTQNYEFDLLVDTKSVSKRPYELAVREAAVPGKVSSRFTLDINALPTSADPADELPREVSLSQNYPNPFNPATSIRFGLPETQSVTLQVFDLSGRLIATLANGVRTAGFHEVRFDGSSLASGVYFYRLQTDAVTYTRKFTLLK
jgi:hypothetical protein